MMELGRRRLPVVLCGLVALVPHVVLGVRPAFAAQCSTTGFSPGSGITWESDADLARDLDQVAAAGAQWLRIDVPWSVIEPQRGAFNWPDIDRMVNATTARNLKIIGILHLTPQWARAPGSDSDLWPPVNVSEYANYVKATVQRYSGKVKVWEIWNEPNITVFWHPKPDPAAYTALLKAGFAAVKSADPAATVLTAGLSPAVDAADGSQVAPATFLTRMYEAGAKGSFDAVAIHPYSYPARPLDPSTSGWNTFYRIPLFYEVMVKNGDGDKRIWLTEYGAPTGTDPSAVNDAQQAQLIADGYDAVSQFPWVNQLLVYSVRDAGTNLADREDNFGVRRRDFSAKPALDAFTQATSRCGATQPPQLSVDDVSVVEGNSGTTDAVFTVNRWGDTTNSVSVQYATGAGTATAGTDFVSAAATTLTFAPGETSKRVPVAVKGDGVVEGDETFSLKLSAPVGAAIADDTGVATIVNDDAYSSFSVNDVRVSARAGSASFTITRSGNTTETASVRATTSSGTAVAGSDFVHLPLTTIGFSAGQTSKTVTISIIDDGDLTDETFYVKLLQPVRATIADDTGVGTITNEDRLAAGVSIDDVTVIEGNSGTTNATFTVTRTGDATGGASVRYSTSSGTAVAGEDFVGVAATTVSFASGETSKPVTVAVQGDAVDEPNETFTVNLSSPVGAVISDDTGVGTIVDDDVTIVPGPSSFLSVNDVALKEGNSGTTAATFTVSRSGDTSKPASVQYTTASGSAEGGTDYSNVPLTTLSFAAGDKTKTVPVPVIGDTRVEPNQTFSLKLSGAVNATIADDTGTGTILNDDAGPSTGVSIDDVAVTEGDSGTTTATFTVTRSFDTAKPASVQYTTLPGTAVAGADYVNVPSTALNFAPGETSKTVPVSVLGDTAAEPNETFTVKLSSPSGTTISDDTGTATIRNDDAGVRTISVSDVTVREGNSGTVDAAFAITRSGDASGTASVSYRTVAGSATEGVDYVGVAPTTASFAAGETTKNVTVRVNGDTLAEANETFSLSLSSPVGAVLADVQGTATIVDDDGLLPVAGPSTFVSISDASVPEGDAGSTPATFTVTRSGDTSGVLSVEYATGGGSAAPVTDYTGLPVSTLVFAAGETTKTVTVAVNGDPDVEPDETFEVKLTLPLLSPATVAISDDTGVGTILDDDVTRTALAAGDAIIGEGDSGTKNAVFTITRTGDTSGTSSVRYTTVGGTASTGIDFVGVSLTTVVFAAGETSKTISVPVKGDTALETDEAFAVILSSPVGGVITDDKGVGTITNDDGLPPALSIDDVSVMEGDAGTTNATFTVTRTGNTTGSSSVRYATASGSAAAGSDFVGAPLTTVSFAPGETSKPVTVAVQGDAVDEPNETFTVNLSSPVGAVISDATGVGTVVDDDVTIVPGPSTFLSVDDVAVREGDFGTTAATFTVTRSGDRTRSASVQYTTVAETATGGADYGDVPLSTLAFAPDETTKTVTVPVTGDTEIEPTETFSLKLTSAVDATISDDTGTGTILNDDGGLSTVAVNDVSVVEGSSGTTAARFSVTRSGDATRPASVQYTTVAGTATGGTDYTDVALTTLAFAAGETTKTVSVPVIGDSSVEPTETFSLKLSTPVDVTISDDTGTATILNDDTLPSVSIFDVNVVEGAAGVRWAVVTVMRRGDLSGTSIVQYATVAGTATDGVDYVGTPTTSVAFQPGEAIKTVAFAVNGDTAGETDETFFVNLSNATGATVADAQGIVKILNDD